MDRLGTVERGQAWRAIAASVAGTGHERRSLPNQDAVAWRSRGGWLWGAVADGAGSAARSQWGAQRAVETVTAVLGVQVAAALATSRAGSDRPDPEPQNSLAARLRDGLKTSLALARADLETLARQENIPLRELACTTIAIAAGPNLAIAAQIGDGAAVVADAAGQCHTLTRPQQGEYANETVFLTGDGAIAAIVYGEFQGTLAHVALFSDGLQRLALELPSGDPFGPFFAPLFQFVQASDDPAAAQETLSAFLRSPKVTARTDDDLTLLLGSLHPGQGDRPTAENAPQ
ncbi:MAG: protein phosphatase 2C domain-containing protein [Cyanobacteria bacterium]|nr:protein phosphatase 2C domain-containing protein [Cyanobacteriota bacterium]